MKRDTVVFTICGFALGLVVGSFLIGPKLASTSLGPTGGVANAAESSAAPAAAAAPAPSMDQMNAVRQQLATLKQTIEKDPRNDAALAQLGGMYMDATKYPQAAEYFERALAVREDATIRTDLGICYKQNGQLDKALAAFQRAAAEAPDQWQALYNEAVVLGELQRWDEAQKVAANLKAMRPNDPQVAQLAQAIETRTTAR